jgi:Flp pilus assembly protein TadD
MHIRIKLGSWPIAALLGTLALAGCARPGPTEGMPTPRLADAALEAGYPQMALSVADHILARDPRNVPALVARGDALLNSGRPDEAATAYQQALAVKPADAAANGGLARIMIRRDPHAAERLLRTALASRPDDAVLLANLGVALDLQDRHVEAQTAYRQSLRVAPNSTATKTNLGLSLALSGDRAGAQRVLAPLAADPSAAQVVRDNLAVAQMQAIAPAAAPAAVAPPVAAPPAAPAPAAPAATMPAPGASRTAPAPTPIAPIAAAAPAAPAPEPVGGYVQLTAADSQAAAEADWQRESRRTGTLLADRAPQIAAAVVNGRTFWRLRVPVATPLEGRRLCASLEAKGSHCWTSSPSL